MACIGSQTPLNRKCKCTEKVVQPQRWAYYSMQTSEMAKKKKSKYKVTCIFILKAPEQSKPRAHPT